jgi:hypothetical protein
VPARARPREESCRCMTVRNPRNPGPKKDLNF